MASTSKMPQFETRTRIDCRFPMNRKASRHTPNQIRVMTAFLSYLQTTDITGFTMSSLLNNVYSGFWRPTGSGDFEKENVVTFLIDHPLEKDDPKLWAFVADLKREIQRLYHRYSDQKEQDVWIVVHAIDRLA
jgi:hypothetical protein